MKMFFTVPIVAAALMAGSFNLHAAHEGVPHKEKSANEIIGAKVSNAQNENLGKVHDIIINVDSGNAPYAVIATGGLTDRNKVAVPLSSLTCSADGKSMVLNATKDQLQAASKTPSGAWSTSSDSAWSKNVDGYYGQPTMRDRTGRDTFRDSDRTTGNRTTGDRTTGDRTTGDRTYVRDPAPKGAELLANPQDEVICERIGEKIDALQVRVNNGVAHLYGTVASESDRQKIENQVRTVDGVNKVESHLRIKGR